MVRQRAVGSHEHSACTITLRSRRLGQDLSQGRGLHAGCPDDRVRRDASLTARRLDVHAVAIDARHKGLGANLDSDALEPGPGSPRQSITERCEDVFAGVEEEHDGARGVDRTKVAVQCAPGELGDLSSDLAPGRTAADDGEGQPLPALCFRWRRLGQLERREYPPSQVEGVVDRLHREGVLGEFLVSEVRGRGSGGDDQAVVRERALGAQRSDGQDAPVLEVEAGDLGQFDVDVLVLAQDPSERLCDFAYRQDSRRDLVEQGLEQVVVRAVDERDLDVDSTQHIRGMEASEAPADHDHTMSALRHLDQAGNGAPTNSKSALLTSFGCVQAML